ECGNVRAQETFSCYIRKIYRINDLKVREVIENWISEENRGSHSISTNKTSSRTGNNTDEDSLQDSFIRYFTLRKASDSNFSLEKLAKECGNVRSAKRFPLYLRKIRIIKEPKLREAIENWISEQKRRGHSMSTIKT